MDDLDTLIEDVRIVYASLDRLKSIQGPEFRTPGSMEYYQNLLEEAYAAYDRVETTVDELGQALEYEHTRLDQAIKQVGKAQSHHTMIGLELHQQLRAAKY